MINAVRPVRPDFSFLTGWDVVLIPMMLMGADGGTNATSGVVPELMRKLYDLASAKQWDQAIPLQLRLVELFDLMLLGADFPEGFRAAVELRGFEMGRGRQPMSDKQHVDRAALKHSLQCMLSDFNAVDAPGQCAPRAGRNGVGAGYRCERFRGRETGRSDRAQCHRSGDGEAADEEVDRLQGVLQHTLTHVTHMGEGSPGHPRNPQLVRRDRGVGFG